MSLQAPLQSPLGESDIVAAQIPGAALDVYGEDVLFVTDLTVTPSGDWAIVNGEENVRRSIYRMLMTRPGEFRPRPEYGVGIQTYVKKRRTTQRIAELKQAILSGLAADRRIQKTEVTVENIDNGIKVRVKAVILGRVVTFKPFIFTGEE